MVQKTRSLLLVCPSLRLLMTDCQSTWPTILQRWDVGTRGVRESEWNGSWRVGGSLICEVVAFPIMTGSPRRDKEEVRMVIRRGTACPTIYKTYNGDEGLS